MSFKLSLGLYLDNIRLNTCILPHFHFHCCFQVDYLDLAHKLISPVIYEPLLKYISNTNLCISESTFQGRGIDLCHALKPTTPLPPFQRRQKICKDHQRYVVFILILLIAWFLVFNVSLK